MFFYSAPSIPIAKNSIPLQESISVSQPSPTLLENLTDDALAYLYKWRNVRPFLSIWLNFTLHTVELCSSDISHIHIQRNPPKPF